MIKKAFPPGVSKEALERRDFEVVYEGYCLDLVKRLAKELKFKYEFHLVGDGKYGNLNEETGEWNGMIRELRDRVKTVLPGPNVKDAAADFVLCRLYRMRHT